MTYKHNCPHHAQCLADFDQKQLDPHASPSLFTQSHPSDSLVSQVDNVLKEKCFTSVEEVKQKRAEALEGIKINKFQNCFEQWEKCLNRSNASNGGYFEGA